MTSEQETIALYEREMASNMNAQFAVAAMESDSGMKDVAQKLAANIMNILEENTND